MDRTPPDLPFMFGSHQNVPQERVVIIGGGFGGLYAAQYLPERFHLTLIDRRNHHLFQPLLYQVATGGLSPGDISSPLRAILKRRKNTEVLLADVRHIDVRGKRAILRDGEVPYDWLVVATGVRHGYFGRDEWESEAPGLKSIEDALDIRRRIFLAFETAEREPDEERRRALLTFVVIGGGPTGVELAGAVAELAGATLRNEFRRIRPHEQTRIILVEGRDRILPSYPPSLSRRAQRSLEKLGVTVRCNLLASEIEGDRVVIEGKAGEREVIETRTKLWAAGVEASPLGRVLSDRTGAELDRSGRIVVKPDLSVPGATNIFVIGDLACARSSGGDVLPGVAPVAMAQGRYVAGAIGELARGREPQPFRYRDRGSLAVIGRKAAVADLGRVHLSGVPAWLAWIFVHIWYLIEFDNKLLVMLQWAFDFFTRKRGARLITGTDPHPVVRAGAAAEETSKR